MQARVQRGAGTSLPIYLPAPLGGVNTRDPPAMVPVTEAIAMYDCYPSSGGIKARTGYTSHTTGLAATARSLMVYSEQDGTEAMFCAAGTAFYDVSSSGAAGAAVVSGLSNAIWQSINFTNSAGTSYLCCFNGVDSPRYWDGSSWLTITGASTPAITGLTTSSIASAFVHQRRMWLIEVDSLKLWYLPADSVGGEAKALELGGIATMGGYIMAGAAFAFDSGSGLNDYLVVITSEGQVVAYRGTDPSSASTWEHVGTWNISEPTGRRCMTQFKGDVLITTRSGLASFARVVAGAVGNSIFISDKISGSYREYWSSAGSNTDWHAVYVDKQDVLVLGLDGANSPRTALAMNASTGAWGGEFSLSSRALAIYNGSLYYTSGATIRALWTGSQSEGDVEAQVYTGFSDLGAPGVMKKPCLMRAVISTDDDHTFYYGLQRDSIISAAIQGVSLPATQGTTPWLQFLGLAGITHSFYASILAPGDNEQIIAGFYITVDVGGPLGASAHS